MWCAVSKTTLVVHVEGSINPRRDVETIQIELALADLSTVERRRERVQKTAKSGDKAFFSELEVLDKLQPTLEEFKAARTVSLSDDELTPSLATYFLLTMKPTIYAANVNEAALGAPENDEHVKKQCARSPRAKELNVWSSARNSKPTWSIFRRRNELNILSRSASRAAASIS